MNLINDTPVKGVYKKSFLENINYVEVLLFSELYSMIKHYIKKSIISLLNK